LNEGANTAGGTPDPETLAALIRDAKGGSLAAFQRIYDAYARRVLNFVYRLLHSADEAEDITQETFVAVYQKLGTLKDDSRFEPWLFRIARNLVYQRFRGGPPPMVSIDEVDEDGLPAVRLVDTRKTPDESFQSGELEKVVENVIRDLPGKYREVFVLAAVQKLSYQDIAEIVGRGLGSVKTDIHRARLEVRKRVKSYLGMI
jgi:RNA polymerase sigma-70 factor, ECF subfamily